MERLPGVERVRRPFSPERQATPVTHRTPVVVLEAGRWLPGEVLAWWRRNSEWIAQVRTRDGGYRDKTLWVLYDPAKILPVHIDERDFDWWLPPARDWREPRGEAGPGGA